MDLVQKSAHAPREAPKLTRCLFRVLQKTKTRKPALAEWSGYRRWGSGKQHLCLAQRHACVFPTQARGCNTHGLCRPGSAYDSHPSESSRSYYTTFPMTLTIPRHLRTALFVRGCNKTESRKRAINLGFPLKSRERLKGQEYSLTVVCSVVC